MQFYFFGLLSAMFFGISNVYWKTAIRNSSFPILVFFRGIAAVICFAIIWWYSTRVNALSFYFVNTGATSLQYVKAILLCFFCSLGLICYLSSLKYTAVSISVPISSINWFSILTAIIVLGEVFRTIYYLSFGMSLIGILLTQSNRIDKTFFQWNRGATLSLMASFFWGVSYTLFKIVINWLGAIPLAFILESAVTLTACIWLAFNGAEKSKLFSRKNIGHYFVLAFLLIGGTLFFNLAVQKIPILVINILGNFTLIVSFMLGFFIYKEKLSFKQIMGVVFLIGSIILLQVHNS